MSLSPDELAARQRALERMDGRERLRYIITYYGLPILLGAAALVILAATAYRQLTKRDAVLYAALVNVSVGEAAEDALTGRFLAWSGENPRRREVLLYRDLYLSDDASAVNHEYAYASRLKLLGAINAGRLDLVLMNREGYDILSRSGYLLPLTELLDGNAALTPYLTSNEVILEDNAIEYTLNEAADYEAVTETAANALALTDRPTLRDAGFSGAVYLGVIANSPRLDAVTRYLNYLSE